MVLWALLLKMEVSVQLPPYSDESWRYSGRGTEEAVSGVVQIIGPNLRNAGFVLFNSIG
jgi:hypothetical protein